MSLITNVDILDEAKECLSKKNKTTKVIAVNKGANQFVL